MEGMAIGEVAMAYAPGAVERAMKVQEVIVQAIAGKLTWIQAAEILGCSARTIRRYRWRLERDGYDGLFDRRRRLPSPTRPPRAWRALLLCLRQEGPAERGLGAHTPAPRPAPSPPRAARVLRRAPASGRQPASMARPAAGTVVHAHRRRRRRDQAHSARGALGWR